MTSILSHELKSYFYSPIGYVFLGAYFFFTGFFFFVYNLLGNTNDMSSMFEMLFTVTLFLVPILTMRIMSEDKRAKTDQLLFMMPLTDFAIIGGKFIAAALVFLVGISSSLLCGFVLRFFSDVQWSVVFSNFLGLALLGITLLSIGLLISSLTESQVVAAIGGFSVSLLLIALQSIAVAVPNKTLAKALRFLALEPHYTPFTLGIVSLQNVVFFTSIAVFFLFLSTALLKKGR